MTDYNLSERKLLSLSLAVISL